MAGAKLPPFLDTIERKSRMVYERREEMVKFFKRVLHKLRVWDRFVRLQEFKWRRDDPVGYWRYQDRLWSD
jgi:hypothetical protein